MKNICLLFSKIFILTLLVVGICCDALGWVDPSDPYATRRSIKPGGSHMKIDNSRADWIDPSDVHGYDHLTRTKISKKNGKIKRQNLDSVSCSEKTEILESDLASCQSQCHRQHEEQFLYSLLQRLTAKILQTADLPSHLDEGSVFSVERYLILTLEAAELQKLQAFVDNGELDLAHLTSIWDSMLQRADNPEIPKWYSPTSWMPSFQIKNETFYVMMACLLMLTIVAMIIAGVPLMRIIVLFFLLAFTFSVAMKVVKHHQANEARLLHLRNPALLDNIPSACRPHSRDWLETLKHITYSESMDRKACAEHFEDGFSDPMTHIDPFEKIIIQLFDVIIKLSDSLGIASSRFFDTFFDDLPMPWLLRPVLKIITLLFFLAFAAICMVWCTPSVIKSAFESRRSLPRIENLPLPDSAPQNVQQQQPINFNVQLNLPEYISEGVRPRTLSQPAPTREMLSEAPPRSIKKRLSVPALPVCEEHVESPPTPPAEALPSDQEESEEMSPDSGTSSHFIQADNLIDFETAQFCGELSPARSLTSETEAKSPFLIEIKRILEDAPDEDASEK